MVWIINNDYSNLPSLILLPTSCSISGSISPSLHLIKTFHFQICDNLVPFQIMVKGKDLVPLSNGVSE